MPNWTLKRVLSLSNSQVQCLKNGMSFKEMFKHERLLSSSGCCTRGRGLWPSLQARPRCTSVCSCFCSFSWGDDLFRVLLHFCLEATFFVLFLGSVGLADLAQILDKLSSEHFPTVFLDQRPIVCYCLCHLRNGNVGSWEPLIVKIL